MLAWRQCQPRFSKIANACGARLVPTLSRPHLTACEERVNPMYPDASCPRVRIERAHGENAPLLRLPRRVEPKRLGNHPENTRQSPPRRTLILRKPDCDDTAKRDAYLI